MTLKEAIVMYLITAVLGLSLGKIIQLYRKKKGKYR
jgi:hypothetical protein